MDRVDWVDGRCPMGRLGALARFGRCWQRQRCLSQNRRCVNPQTESVAASPRPLARLEHLL